MDNQNIIFLLIGLIFVLFLIYYIFIKSSSGLISFVDLNNKNDYVSINSLPASSSTNYSYSSWINVNTWSNNKKILFTRNNIDYTKYVAYNNKINPVVNQNIITYNHTDVASSPMYDFILRLDDKTPTLYCSFKTPSASSSHIAYEYILTKNFPIQKWTFVVIVLDGINLDFYLDGKITYSVKMLDIPSPTSANLFFGNNSSSNYLANDIYLANVSVWNYSLDPQTVWRQYIGGSGQSSPTNNYKMQISASQDNNKYKLVSFP